MNRHSTDEMTLTVNFHTDASDVAAVPEIVDREGRALDEERRPRELASREQRSVKVV